MVLQLYSARVPLSLARAKLLQGWLRWLAFDPVRSSSRLVERGQRDLPHLVPAAGRLGLASFLGASFCSAGREQPRLLHPAQHPGVVPSRAAH